MVRRFGENLLRGRLSFLPCLPGYFCVDASLHADKRPRITGGLRVMRLKQILPYYGEFHGPEGAPTEPYIAGCVGSHSLTRQRAHIAESLIKLEFLGQIDGRLDNYLVVWA